MTKYVCIGCGFESKDDNVADEPCPYCGEQIVEEKRFLTQEIEEIEAE